MPTLQPDISSSVGIFPEDTRRLTAVMTASLHMAYRSAPVQPSVSF